MNTEQIFFENFISVGWFCGTASSMGKHGLRSYSYPFDWAFSLDFEEVIRYIETGFSDFLQRENLEQTSETAFRDKKHSMIFPHDIETNLVKDYDKIYEKYHRRIKRFKCNIEKPTCFIRTVLDDKEAGYIMNHWEHINKIIKKPNPENKIIFLLLAGSKKIVGLDCCYTVGMDKWESDWNGLRNIFDSAEVFLEFCKTHFVEKEYEKNLEFDQRKFAMKEATEKKEI